MLQNTHIVYIYISFDITGVFFLYYIQYVYQCTTAAAVPDCPQDGSTTQHSFKLTTMRFNMFVQTLQKISSLLSSHFSSLENEIMQNIIIIMSREK